MILEDAQSKVDEVLLTGRWPSFGVKVKYSPRCKRTYVVNCNDWQGHEVFFVMDSRQLSDQNKLRGELKVAWSRLSAKR